MSEYGIIASLDSSPIAQVELRRQYAARQRTRTGAIQWRRWLIGGVYLLALGTGMLYFSAEIIGLLTGSDTWPLYQGSALLQTLQEIMVIVTVSAQLLVMAQTLMAASSTMVRERRSAAWDVLVLTEITPRHLVFAKWWAAFRWMIPAYLWVALLRFGLGVWAGIYLSHHFLSPFGSANSGYNLLPPLIWEVVLSGLVGAVFIFLAGALTAAIGVLAALVAGNRHTAVMIGALLSALLLVVTFLGLSLAANVSSFGCEPMYYGGGGGGGYGGGGSYPVGGGGGGYGRVYYGSCHWMNVTLDNTATNIVTSGMTLSAALAEYHRPDGDMFFGGGENSVPKSATFAFLLPATIIFYWFSTWGALKLAIRAAERQGMLPGSAYT